MASRNFQLFVVGGGSGGVRAARIAARHGAQVAIAEQDRFGGTCVIRGCIPKKLYVYASELGRSFADARGYGWTASASFDWPTLRDRVAAEVTRLSTLYRSNLDSAGVDCKHGRATIVDPHTVDIDGERFTADHILIATGGRPQMLAVPGVEHAISSDQVFHLDALPEHMTVVGAGYIGVEFAAVFRGLGCEVAHIHRGELLLTGFDHDVRQEVSTNLRASGVDLRLEEQVTAIDRQGGRLNIRLASGESITTDVLLSAIGRVPNTGDLGLEHVGVELRENGAVVVDRDSKTSVPSIFAVGDCTNRVNLTPVAIREGHAVADGLFGSRNWQVDYREIPTAVFAQPPAAVIGLTEEEARQGGTAIDVYRTSFRSLMHTLSGRDERVLIKVIVDRPSDRVIGVHMVGKDSPEIIQAAAIAMTMGAKKADFDRTMALHPTTAEELVLLPGPVHSTTGRTH